MVRKLPYRRNLYVESFKVVRGTPPTILRSVPSIGIAVYDPTDKVGYLGNTISEVSLDKEIRAKSTCEPVLRRILRDKKDPSGLYAVLIGDSISSFEYDGTIDDGSGYQNLEKAVENHHSYRQEISHVMIDFGFIRNKIYDFFAKKPENVQEIFMVVEDGYTEIKEFDLNTNRVYEWIRFDNCFREVKIRTH